MFQPEQRIGNYLLVRRIGRGGFGEVWLAERRTKFVTTKVAIKLSLDDQVDHEVIRQEAQLWERASGHPNVLPIIEADEYDGQVVIVSEFAPDGSLEDLLRKNNGLLPVRRAVEISIGILSGLEFLHSQGIIHRDIKPANILIQGNTPRLTDFGISRVMKTNSASQNAAGTPLYMAPEAFDRKRTAQTDLWSVGVMLHQMLSGRVPFPSGNVSELMAAIVLGDPEPLPDHFPISLQKIVAKSLCKPVLGRYQTAVDIREDLQDFIYNSSEASESDVTEWIDLSTIAAPTVGFSQSEKKSIAILPFKNLSGEANSQFYEFSLADAVTTELARLRSLTVRPSSMIAKYQERQIDAREAGKEMRVDSILSAAFLHSGTRLRVTAQLLDVNTGDIIWSDRIDSDAADVFSLQDKITQQIVDGLRLDLTTGEQVILAQRPTESSEAYEEYLRGRDKFARFIFRTLSPGDCEAAIESFTRAVKLDPDFALAWSGIGASYANKVFKGMGSLLDYDEAEIALNKAREIDPNISETAVVLCFIYLARGEKSRVCSELTRLYEQFPNEAPIYFLKGVLHRLNGEYADAINAFDRLERLDPTATVTASWNRARLNFLQGNVDQAFKELDHGADVEPNHPIIKIFRAHILFYTGKRKEAETILREILGQNPHLEGVQPLLAIVLAARDLRTEALENLTQGVLEKAAADHDIAYWVASAYALLGENENAFHWLTRTIKLGLEDLNLFCGDINLANIRDDGRFDELIERIKRDRESNRSQIEH